MKILFSQAYKDLFTYFIKIASINTIQFNRNMKSL